MGASVGLLRRESLGSRGPSYHQFERLMATMRDTFPGYYRPTGEQFRKLWGESFFAFDTNVLLNIYRYTSETREVFFRVLEGLQSRLWVPHQAALEFHRRRLDVIDEQVS